MTEQPAISDDLRGELCRVWMRPVRPHSLERCPPHAQGDRPPLVQNIGPPYPRKDAPYVH